MGQAKGLGKGTLGGWGHRSVPTLPGKDGSHAPTHSYSLGRPLQPKHACLLSLIP